MSHANTPAMRFRAGTTLMIAGQALGEDGQPASLTGVDLTATVRDASKRLKAELVVEWIDRALGRYELWAPGDGVATGWEPGEYKADVTYTYASGGTGGRPLVLATEKFAFWVTED